MVCGGLRWFSRLLTAHGHTDVLSSQILVVVCGGLRWSVVVCSGLWWFAVVCGGLWWIAVVCLLVIPSCPRVRRGFLNNLASISNNMFLCIMLTPKTCSTLIIIRNSYNPAV